MGKVYLERCDGYKRELVDEALKKLLEPFGGMSHFVKPGMKVAIKPNLLMAKKPETAATTHPEIVAGIVRLVKKSGGISTIIDSPGGPYALGLLNRVYQVTGMEQVADETGALLNQDLRIEKVENPNAAYIKSLKVLKPLVDADVIIDVAKLKTHMMMVYTGAVKNMFGAIGGTEKADYHSRMSDYGKFAAAITDIYLAVKPTLCLIDGIIGMEGTGPGSGTPRHLGALILAENGFEADLAASEIIGLKPNQIPVLKHAEMRGLLHPDAVQYPLMTPAAFLCSDFDNPAIKLNETGGKRSGFISQIGKFARPRLVIRQEDCIKCGRCAQACPVKVIEKQSDGSLIIQPKDCIRCFCCHELCPENAIDIKRNILSKALVHRRSAGLENTKQ